jgi:hypothetical protein
VLGAIGMLLSSIFHEFSDDIRAALWEDPRLKGEWTLLYGDVQETGKQVPTPMTMRLTASMFPTSRGNISGEGQAGEYKRKISGYANDEFIMLAYQTKSGSGIGTVMLQSTYGLSTQFSGFLRGKDCFYQKIMECPAILVKGPINSEPYKAAEKRFGEFLGTPCKSIADAAACTKPMTAGGNESAGK